MKLRTTRNWFLTLNLLALACLAGRLNAQSVDGGVFSRAAGISDTAATNIALAMDNRLFFEPQNQNLNFPFVAARGRAGLPLRIVNFGDDAFKPIYACVAILNTYLKWNGTISGSEWLYADMSAGVSQSTVSTWTGPNLAYLPILTYGLPVNSGITNRSAPLSDTISLSYFKSNYFGTLTIQTNDGYSGTYNTVKVIDCNNGGVLTAAVTNFSVSPGNWRATVISTVSSNLVVFAGQYHSGIGTNYVWDVWEGNTVSVNNVMTNSFCSNSFLTFLQNYDLVILNDSTSATDAYSGFSLLANAVRSRGMPLDMMFLQPPMASNQVGFMYQARQGYAQVASDYNLNMVDTGGALFPYDASKFAQYYLPDGVHLTPAGNALLAPRVVAAISNPFFRVQQPWVQFYSGQEIPIAGVGVTRNNPGAVFDGTRWLDSTMIQQSAANAGYGTIAINLPEWATAATIELYWATAWTGTTLVYWQDLISPYMTIPNGPSAGRVLAPAGNLTINVLATNTVLTAISATQVWPATNVPKHFIYTFNASTNTAARGIVGPIKVTFR